MADQHRLLAKALSLGGQCGARTLPVRDHAALCEDEQDSLIGSAWAGCMQVGVLKLRRGFGKTHEGKPRSEPDWGNPTVRDRRGRTESSCGLEP